MNYEIIQKPQDVPSGKFMASCYDCEFGTTIEVSQDLICCSSVFNHMKRVEINIQQSRFSNLIYDWMGEIEPERPDRSVDCVIALSDYAKDCKDHLERIQNDFIAFTYEDQTLIIELL